MLLAVHYWVMEYMGSLESTQEARFVLGYCLGQLLCFFCALQTSHVLQNSIVHAESMNQLFYNIASGIVHQIRRKKRTNQLLNSMWSCWHDNPISAADTGLHFYESIQ